MNTPTKPVEQKARELLAMPECDDLLPFDDEGRNGYLESPLDWTRRNQGAVEWLANNHAAIRAALNTDEERIRREAFEEAAKVADMLGGVRERLPLIEGNNAEAKFRRHNRGQHVRAATIAKAIRSLSTPSKGVG